MSKTVVIYWSGTGNTEAMANAIAAAAGAEIFEVSSVVPAIVKEYDKIAFGCPAMGNEVLEEGEFEPFFSEAEGFLGGKKVALFGSYGWGDGTWMRDWEERVSAAGAGLFENGLAVNEAPDDAALAECERFGKSFSEF